MFPSRGSTAPRASKSALNAAEQLAADAAALRSNFAAIEDIDKDSAASKLEGIMTAA